MSGGGAAAYSGITSSQLKPGTVDTVTLDEIGSYEGHQLQTGVNGQVVQTTLGAMVFDIPRLIEYCSGFTPLEAGDVTEVGIDGIWVLRNTVVAEPRS
jgi:2-keto-4-pentenoate hydratase/2-oxohepta-3-ene-1,7-dioic acid hydratase in catechol pathway